MVHHLLLLLARATEKELVQMVEYLKTENRILRKKLPKHINVITAERAKLLKLGVRLGSRIKEVITLSIRGRSRVGSAKRHPVWCLASAGDLELPSTSASSSSTWPRTPNGAMSGSSASFGSCEFAPSRDPIILRPVAVGPGHQLVISRYDAASLSISINSRLPFSYFTCELAP